MVSLAGAISALVLPVDAELLTSVGIPAVAGRPGEYRGKPYSYWIERLRDKNPDVRYQAASALSSVEATDRALLPALTAAIKDPERRVRLRVVTALSAFEGEVSAAETLEAAASDQDEEFQPRRIPMRVSVSQQ